MNIARPAGGFNLNVAPAVRAFVDEVLPRHPELPRHWKAVLVRLRETAHKDGQPVDGDPSQRVGVFQPYFDGPRFKMAWRVLGDTVTIVAADF